LRTTVTSKVIDAAESTAPIDMAPALPTGEGRKHPASTGHSVGTPQRRFHRRWSGLTAGLRALRGLNRWMPRRPGEPSSPRFLQRRDPETKTDRLNHPSAWLRAVSFSTLSLDPEALGVARDPGACRGACRTAESAGAAEKEKLTAGSTSSASRPLLRLFDPETQRPLVLTFGTPEVLSVPCASSASKAFSTTDGARWLQDRGRSVFRILNIGGEAKLGSRSPFSGARPALGAGRSPASRLHRLCLSARVPCRARQQRPAAGEPTRPSRRLVATVSFRFRNSLLRGSATCNCLCRP